MLFSLTSKGCQLSPHSFKTLDWHLQKISKNLPHFREDLPLLRLVLRRNIDKYYPKSNHSLQHKSYSKIKPALAYFEGSMTFRLDKKRLYVNFKGQTVDECLKTGFDRIYKELEKYKDLHFPAESEYPDHSTIRSVAYQELDHPR